MPELQGIDISSWQGDIAWERVKKAGATFVFVRAAAGLQADKRFAQNMMGAAAQGIPCGAYVYSLARTPQQAQAEANFVLGLVKPYTLRLPIAYDIEDKAQSALTNAQRTDLVVHFCTAVAAAGYRPMVYSSLSWFETKFEPVRIAAYDKWVARWGTAGPGLPGAKIWQYTSTGRVDGIAANVDRNISYVDYTAGAAKPPAAAPAQPSPPPAKPAFKAGQRVVLRAAPLYAAAASSSKVRAVSGIYWVYDGQVVNGRLRITNSAANVNKTPVGQYVTGYIPVSAAGV